MAVALAVTEQQAGAFLKTEYRQKTFQIGGGMAVGDQRLAVLLVLQPFLQRLVGRLFHARGAASLSEAASDLRLGIHFHSARPMPSATRMMPQRRSLSRLSRDLGLSWLVVSS